VFAERLCGVGHPALVRGDGVVLEDGLPVQIPAPSLTAWKQAGKGRTFSMNLAKRIFKWATASAI